MWKKAFSLMFLVAVFSCDNSRKTGDERDDGALPVMEVPQSNLGIRINFPAKELESGLNRILPKILVDDVIPLKSKSDSLFLKIIRKGNLKLSISGGEVLASIPLDIEASVVKKVLGITFSNVDTPVRFSGTARSTARVGLRDDWELDVICQWKGFDWEDQPTISLAGVSLDLESTIERFLAGHADELSNVICGAIQNAVSFREILNKLWMDIQQPIPLDADLAHLWLSSTPSGLSGMTIPKDDTLSVSLEYRTVLDISSKKGSPGRASLPERTDLLNDQGVFVAFPGFFLSYQDLEKLLSEELVDERYEYEGYEIMIRKVTVTHQGQALEFILKTAGDITGTLTISGKPELDEEMQLKLSDFKYELESEEEWVALTDLALHAFAEDYITSLVTFDVRSLVEEIDRTAVTAIARSEMGSKMMLRLDLANLRSYQLRMTEKGVQWIFVAEGRAAIDLKSGLFR